MKYNNPQTCYLQIQENFRAKATTVEFIFYGRNKNFGEL